LIISVQLFSIICCMFFAAANIHFVCVEPGWDTVLNNACFSLRITLERRNLMINVFVNFISSIWSHLYPTHFVCYSSTKGVMKLGHLLIGRSVNKSMFWHQKLQDIQQNLNWIQKNYFVNYPRTPMSINYLFLEPWKPQSFFCTRFWCCKILKLQIHFQDLSFIIGSSDKLVIG
jgi:hypothetical protein